MPIIQKVVVALKTVIGIVTYPFQESEPNASLGRKKGGYSETRSSILDPIANG
jgi:hypothetical protein